MPQGPCTGSSAHGPVACVDVAYRGDLAIAACVVLGSWTDGEAIEETVYRVEGIGPYRSGEFYRRELAPIVTVLRRVSARFSAIVIDGYVWLDAEGRPGLGAFVHRELAVPVVGVAKSKFGDARFACRVLRGTSGKPLYVTAAGMPPEEAAACVRSMHGPHRIPTALKRADLLCRG